jgi:hypothetical protein
MSTAAGRRAGSLPGVVTVRLSGGKPELDALAAIMASDPAMGILTGPSGPRRNRREPGHRLYLTVRVQPHAVKQGGASAQPPSNPLAPQPLQGGTSHDDA